MRWRGLLFGVGIALLFGGFCALGTWQLFRLSWKLDLIARIEQRVHAEPASPPGRADWPTVSAARDEYRRVRVHGRLRHDREALVLAVTERGPGFWVLTPLETDEGTLVLVNRGYVDATHRERALHTPPLRFPDPDAPVEIVGLLRLSEPRGGFLRDNDPAQDRWYSRDVEAIAAARGLPADAVAPYFIDAEADAAAGAEAWPVGGLTVLRFHNSHLMYALTWFGLALLTLVAARIVLRRERGRAGGDDGD